MKMVMIQYRKNLVIMIRTPQTRLGKNRQIPQTNMKRTMHQLRHREMVTVKPVLNRARQMRIQLMINFWSRKLKR